MLLFPFSIIYSTTTTTTKIYVTRYTFKCLNGDTYIFIYVNLPRFCWVFSWKFQNNKFLNKTKKNKKLWEITLVRTLQGRVFWARQRDSLSAGLDLQGVERLSLESQTFQACSTRLVVKLELSDQIWEWVRLLFLKINLKFL